MKIFGRYTNLVRGNPMAGFMRKPKHIYEHEVTEDMLSANPYYLAYCRDMLKNGGYIVRYDDKTFSNPSAAQNFGFPDMYNPGHERWNPNWRKIYEIEEKKWNFDREVERFIVVYRLAEKDWPNTLHL